MATTDPIPVDVQVRVVAVEGVVVPPGGRLVFLVDPDLCMEDMIAMKAHLQDAMPDVQAVLVPAQGVAVVPWAGTDVADQVAAGNALVHALYHAPKDWIVSAPAGVMRAIIRAQRAYRVTPPHPGPDQAKADQLADLIDNPARPLVDLW